ncbi:MAG TPA: DoxX family membrane protein [Candidatus Baltobacteraceae bacterium]|nr:DoxX family membrane protein [Candidatus Baltobacteraceae bacterium]
MDAALLFVRLVVGLAIAAHGAQKLFGWFGGYGLAGTGGFFEGLGFRPGRVFAFFAGLGEAGGGALIALGLGGALGPALVVVVMLVAIFTVHITKGFFITNGGWELNAIYIAAVVEIAYVGFGAYSFDRAIGFAYLSSAQAATVLMIAAIVLAALNLLVRRSAPQQTT